MRYQTALVLSVLLGVLAACKEKPLPPPTPEAVAAFAEAAYTGDAARVAEALKNGMPVEQKDESGNSGLMLASFDGHTEAMQALLDAGADINARNADGRTPLMFAASGPYPAAVKLLIAHGAEINAIDKEEHFTALMFAAAEGLSPVVDVLLAAGADPKMQDVDNDTAANFARQRGFIELADRLQALTDAPKPSPKDAP